MEEHSAQPASTSGATQPRWQRAALWALLCLGLGTALWPLGQGLSGWWSQRALRQSWQQAWASEVRLARAEAATSRRSTKSTKIRKGRHGAKGQRGGAASVPAPPRRWLPTRIVIPSIGLDAIVVRGVSEAALRRGPGHDSASALPGQSGNCVVAAHRNAYGWWFYKLNQLSTNARIELRTPRASYIYSLASTQVLPETSVWALRPPPKGSAPRLTLYTCALPHGSQRIVVMARLIQTLPAA